MRLNFKVGVYLGGLIGLWLALCTLFAVPLYILPHPADVALSVLKNGNILAWHGAISLFEILSGLIVGSILAALMVLIAERFPKKQKN